MQINIRTLLRNTNGIAALVINNLLCAYWYLQLKSVVTLPVILIDQKR